MVQSGGHGVLSCDTKVVPNEWNDIAQANEVPPYHSDTTQGGIHS